MWELTNETIQILKNVFVFVMKNNVNGEYMEVAMDHVKTTQNVNMNVAHCNIFLLRILSTSIDEFAFCCLKFATGH